MMNPINKHTVMKKVRENRVWKGYISPSNVNSAHIVGGWQLGMPVEIRKDNFKYFVWSNDQEMELSAYLNNFAIHNCNSELGQRIRFWEE